MMIDKKKSASTKVWISAKNLNVTEILYPTLYKALLASNKRLSHILDTIWWFQYMYFEYVGIGIARVKIGLATNGLVTFSVLFAAIETCGKKKSITVLDCMHKSIISIVTWRSIVLELIQRRLHTHLSLHSIFHANEQTIVGESVLQLIFFHYHLNYIECTDNCLTCDFLSNWLNLTLKHWTWHAHFIGKLFKTKKENTYLLCVRKSHQLQ